VRRCAALARRLDPDENYSAVQTEARHPLKVSAECSSQWLDPVLDGRSRDSHGTDIRTISRSATTAGFL
jgi:hypothetical protein